MRVLLLATTNRHKVEEYRTIFADLPYRILSLDDIGLDMDVEETGTTFEANSQLKALAYAHATGMLVLADDSGLQIDALDGAPGVYSARFLGPEATYEERFHYILEKLRALPKEQRTARFRCATRRPPRECTSPPPACDPADQARSSRGTRSATRAAISSARAPPQPVSRRSPTSRPWSRSGPTPA